MTNQDQQPEVTFLIQEYKSIAATHDKLRDLQAMLFNYFLLVCAFPFTVAGIVFRNGGFDVMAAPLWLHFLFLFSGLGDLLLALTLLDARLEQYTYARTVNLIRKYFSDQNPRLSGYLYLPVRSDTPTWTSLGYVWYQVVFMVFVGLLFVGFGVYTLLAIWASALVVAGCFGLYLLFYLLILNQYKRYHATTPS
jgi:hypothetical protein